MSSERYRNFKFVIWQESLPSDVWTKADESNIKLLISPLHDKDVNPSGELKKPHYHGIYLAPGKKTFEGAKEIILSIFGKSVNTVFVCDDVGSAVRYFFHLDSPSKYPYRIEDYKEFGGADLLDAMRTVSDLKKYDRMIIDTINDLDIRYYDDLVDYVTYVNEEWRESVIHRTIHWTAYLKARHDKIEKNQRNAAVRTIINRARKD